MRRKICGIYCIENLVNNKKYIGKSSTDIHRRFKHHENRLNKKSHKNFSLQRDWNFYKKENFIFYIVEMFDDVNVDIINEREIFYIKNFNAKYPNGYNLTDGGDGGLNPSQETRDKLRLANKGKIISNEQKERIRESNHTRGVSDETKEKISKTKKSANLIGEKSPLWGKPLAEETKRLLSIAHKGKNHLVTDETRKKMSESSGGVKRNGRSKYLGVRWHERDNSWDCTFQKSGIVYWVGSFKSEINAAIAHDKYVIKNNIDRPLNFSEDNYDL